MSRDVVFLRKVDKKTKQQFANVMPERVHGASVYLWIITGNNRRTRVAPEQCKSSAAMCGEKKYMLAELTCGTCSDRDGCHRCFSDDDSACMDYQWDGDYETNMDEEVFCDRINRPEEDQDRAVLEVSARAGGEVPETWES